MKVITIICMFIFPCALLGMTSDKDLPHIDPYEAGDLYALMMKVDTVLRDNAITYWAGWGTLLGAIRHEGLIPWDDDLDIVMFQDDIDALKKLEPQLNELGLTLLGIGKNEIHYYKIFPIHGKPYEKYPWRYPFIDIFPMKHEEGKIHYVSKRLRTFFENDYFLLEELSFPLNEVPFGPMQIPIPHNAAAILERLYGSDWNQIAYAQYDHKEEKKLEVIKVPLVERASVAYILPK